MQSDAVGSIRPYSMGGPLYLSKSGSTVEAFTVSTGKTIGAVPRTAPMASGTVAPSSVTSLLQTPLKARTLAM